MKKILLLILLLAGCTVIPTGLIVKPNNKDVATARGFTQNAKENTTITVDGTNHTCISCRFKGK